MASIEGPSGRYGDSDSRPVNDSDSDSHLLPVRGPPSGAWLAEVPARRL